MEFVIKNQSKKNSASKSIPVPAKILSEVIALLGNVECTCVWSERDNQYIKVNDIPSSLVSELKMLEKLGSNSHFASAR